MVIHMVGSLRGQLITKCEVWDMCIFNLVKVYPVHQICFSFCRSGASYRNFLKGVRLAACALSLVWAITIYSAWSKRRRFSCNGLRGCNGRRGHSKSYEIRRSYTSL
jgi:hypothetical protein